MSRNANLIILCEDQQHQAFARRFLTKRGYGNRDVRVVIAKSGQGSAEQFVREEYPKEVAQQRARRHRVIARLIVIIDADGKDREAQLAKALKDAGHSPRETGEGIAVFLPARNIETWFAYLDGQSVDETKRYPRLDRERDCRRHADALSDMCNGGALREPAPDSLRAACDEFRSRVKA
jgi:hypothetical protein